MVDVTHSSLTGAELHEPKGVDAADADQVYISDGTGSGAWTSIGSLNPFGAALLHVQHRENLGTSGGSLTHGVWTPRKITTTLTNQISGASIASNRITLPAGTYFLDGAFEISTLITTTTTLPTCSSTDQIRLKNITADSNLLFSLAYSSTVSHAGTVVDRKPRLNIIRGYFTLAAESSLEFQHYVLVSGSTTCEMGQAGNIDVERYADVLIWKIS